MIYAVTYSHNRHETDPMCILCNLQTFAVVCRKFTAFRRKFDENGKESGTFRHSKRKPLKIM